MQLVPDTFTVPEKLEHPKFLLRKLCMRDAYLDYLAVMTSIDVIQKTRGGRWPSPDLSFEDDLIDLAWHQREFERRSSFAYTVMNPDETECLGCVYFFPPDWRGADPKDADVDVSFWVTQRAYDQGLYQVLYKVITKWLRSSWPFKRIHFSNRVLP
jgi:RimJ/RimL family protein N-acetyltransferase